VGVAQRHQGAVEQLVFGQAEQEGGIGIHVEQLAAVDVKQHYRVGRAGQHHVVIDLERLSCCHCGIPRIRLSPV
jgi:hypothetical protein